MWKRCETFHARATFLIEFTFIPVKVCYTVLIMETGTPSKKSIRFDPALLLSVCAATALAALFVLWAIKNLPSVPALCAAFVSLSLFVIGCWRFVPGWFAFWKPTDGESALPQTREPRHMLLLIAAISVLVEFVLLFGVEAALVAVRGVFSEEEALWIWRSLDSGHYLDIAREWYVFGEEWGRTVQLVFLPGYPIAVYPLYRILDNDLLAGMLVSLVSYPVACCVFYRLLRLDLPHNTALRAVSFLWLLPGGFFFVAPMSESLYLLLCLACLYCARKERFMLAGLFGAYAAFTRSLGLLLLVPILMETIHAWRSRDWKRRALSLVSALLVPVGFLCYLRINYVLSGDPFQFLTYQRDHWGQRLGWFFATAAYQTDLLIEKFATDWEMFLGLWLPNLLWHFGVLTAFALTSKRLRPTYAAWLIAYFVIAIGTTWLLSGPRYLLAMPVVALMLGVLTDKKWKYWLLFALLVPLSVLYLVAFVLRWQVW